ncbi:WD_REPEATS_REGION domain-containing protein, partial [Haematococcus lacustris]
MRRPMDSGAKRLTLKADTRRRALMTSKLKKFLLRYYPPGIILQYERDGCMKQKPVDLLGLSPDTDVEVVCTQIIQQEPLVSENRRPALRQLINRLLDKMAEEQHHSYSLFKVLRAHILPLTNCAFNKAGDRFITGSYDRTCKVYAIAFNNPYGDKIVTGSFDKTAKLWDAYTGQLYYTLKGHTTEIVCLSFNPQSTMIATGSMDNTAKLWDVETGKERCTLSGHRAEIVSLNFNTTGDLIATGSFDHDSRLWDVRDGSCVQTLSGHRGEVSSTQFNHTGNLVLSGSIDTTCRLWDVRTGRCLSVKQGHTDEVLDVAFDAAGAKFVSARWVLCKVQPHMVREQATLGMTPVLMPPSTATTSHLGLIGRTAKVKCWLLWAASWAAV